MERQGDEIHITTDEARGGSTPGRVRFVLIAGLILIAIAFTIIVLTGALSSPQDERVGDISNQVTPDEPAAKRK